VVALAAEFFVELFFNVSSAACRDQTDHIVPWRIDHSPMPPLDEADGEVPQFARIFRGENDNRASPKRCSGGETEAVLSLIARALDWVPIKFHFEFVLTLSRSATAINVRDVRLLPRKNPGDSPVRRNPNSCGADPRS